MRVTQPVMEHKSTSARNNQVIDTITVHQSRILLSTGSSIRSAFAQSPVVVCNGFEVRCVGVDRYRFWNRNSGIVAYFAQGLLRYAQASLPRVLFGNNGSVIAWQHEIDEALATLNKALDLISRRVSKGEVFTRVDLVWQFDVQPSEFHRALLYVRHPLIRQNPIDYGNKGLEWRSRSRGAGCKIVGYDKLLKDTKTPGNVTRLEVQLRGSRLKQLVGSGASVTRLDFAQCYQAYRTIIQKFRPKPVPKIAAVVDLIAYANTLGVDLWPHWSQHYRNSRSLNRARRQFAARKLTYSCLNWDALLPNRYPRLKIDIDSRGDVVRTLLIRARARRIHLV